MSAALAAVRASKDPRLDIAITPDGPRGPRYQVQPGLIRIAQMTPAERLARLKELQAKAALVIEGEASEIDQDDDSGGESVADAFHTTPYGNDL